MRCRALRKFQSSARSSSRASEIPKKVLKNAINSFAFAVFIHPFLDQISRQVIEHLREASMCLPDLHLVSFVLFFSFVSRFVMTLSIDAYGNAMTILDGILS